MRPLVDSDYGYEVIEIPLRLIDQYPDHPFYVDDDDDMLDLAASIEAVGQLTPACVRPKKNGRFELLSGHRRMRACQIAGMETMRCEVREMNDAEAAIFLVEANRQRDYIRPGEKAFAFQLREDAAEELYGDEDPFGYISELRSENVGNFDRIGSYRGDRDEQIEMILRITELIPELIDLIDSGQMALKPALEISFLPKLKQGELWLSIEEESCLPSHAQTIRMRRLEEEHLLTASEIRRIMREKKPNQREKITFTNQQIKKMIPDNIPEDRRKEFIVDAVKFYREMRKQYE
jgi:ParB family chromosome partitioning protein